MLRLPDLGSRPFHGDEAVHAFKFRTLWKEGRYRYNPNEFHGPTIYYAALPSVWLHHRRDLPDTTEADFRIVPALFGAALVLLLLLFADGLGPAATLTAALLLALSPAFVTFSRDYIQETLFVFFTLGALGCGWRWARSRQPAWILGTGLFCGVMLASKETSALSFAAAIVSVPLAGFWSRRVDRPSTSAGEPALEADRSASPTEPHGSLQPPARGVTVAWLAGGIVCAAFVAELLLSGLFHNPRAIIDLFRAASPWLNHAGTLHRAPWNYYLKLLAWSHQPGGQVWSEGLILALAVVGGLSALLPATRGRLEGSPGLARFLLFYTLVLTAIYSAIPYKTPWCVLSFLAGMIMLAGTGAAAIARWIPFKPVRALFAVVLLAGCIQLGGQAVRANIVTPVENPYNYAQPVQDIVNLGRKVAELARTWHEHDATVIKVYSVDNYYWPLPWYLRQFPNVGYWNSLPPDPSAPIIIASPEFDDALTKLLPNHLMTGYFGLRPGVFLELWVRMDVWKAHLAAAKPARSE